MHHETHDFAPKTILAATDLSPRADDALRLAKVWADRHDADLTLLHVVPNVVGMNVLAPQRTAQQHELQTSLAEHARAAVEARANALIASGPRTTVRVATGDAAREILLTARKLGVDMVILGDSGVGSLTRALFGRTAKKVLHNAGVAVLIARASGGSHVTLAATDFSDPALPALRAGIARARSHPKGRVVLFHSVDEIVHPVYAVADGIGAPPAPTDVADELVAAARDRLEATAVELGATREDVKIGLAGAASQILAAAEEVGADLIVVGSHGRGAIGRFVVGSVSDSVAQNAHCPVLVVPLAGRQSRREHGGAQ